MRVDVYLGFEVFCPDIIEFVGPTTSARSNVFAGQRACVCVLNYAFRGSGVSRSINLPLHFPHRYLPVPADQH